MPNRRTVVKMRQNKGLIKLQQRFLINKFPKSKYYVKLIIYFLTDVWYVLSKESLLSVVIPNISIELFTGKQKLCSVSPRIRAWCFFSLTIVPLFLYLWFATFTSWPCTWTCSCTLCTDVHDPFSFVSMEHNFQSMTLTFVFWICL